MSEQSGIAVEHLRACLQDQYNLFATMLESLSLGHDYEAEIYRAVSEQGDAYLLKATSRSLYEPRYLVPRYLNDQGIISVVAPVPTKSQALWTKLSDWTVSVYPWVSGECSLTGMTHAHWREVGAIFKQIHQVMPPPLAFESLRKETFDPTEYIRWIGTFEAQYAREYSDGSASQRALWSSWVAHQPTIHTATTQLQQLAERIQRRAIPFVICHADLHARNLIRDQAGHVFVIDWDEVMLAPRERDFIFIRQPQADAFWEGYGVIEMDWMLLSYYLWERVVQDLIYNAQNVCFRDDLAEEVKVGIVQRFHEGLVEGGSILNAAYEASERARMMRP